MRYLVAGASLLAVVLSAPAAAAAHKSHHGGKTGAVSVKSVQNVTPPDFGALFTLMDKMFPPQPDPDPARLALARTAVNVMWPEGSYAKMLSGMLGGMYDRAMQMKGSDFAALDAKPAKSAPDSTDTTIHDTLAAKDPYFDQRAAAIRGVLEEEAAKLSAIIDPRMREGLSRAMARKLDEHQLTDVDAFFATPSGRAFAGQYLQLWLDPDAMRSMMSATPDMMKLMPEAMQKIKEANDKFPEPKKEASEAAKK
jgi:hypothetical protein